MTNRVALAEGKANGQSKPVSCPVIPPPPKKRGSIRVQAVGFKRAAANVATLCCSLILGILAFELVYRIYPFDSIGARPADDRPLFYYSAKGAHKRSDFAYDTLKPAGIFRIVAIGDSFTYPTYMQFDDAYPKRLERILNLASPGERKTEVLNFGKMGLSTSREVVEVAKAVSYNPDLILLEITLNDAELHNFHLEAKKNPGKFSFGDFKVTAEQYPILSHFLGLSFLYERMHRIGAKNAVSNY